MKRNSIYRIGFFALFVIMLTAFSACEKESSIGVEVLPAGDLIDVRNTVIKDDISAFTHREDSINTDKTSNSLLGSLNDSLFGTTSIDFAAQFRIVEFPDFGTNPKADSIKLFLYYRIIYGDTTTLQNFKVYELESSIDPDKTYTQEIDLKSMASDKLLGEINYKPKVKIDSTSKDTVYQLIKITLDKSLGEKLINADSIDMVSNDVFLEYFKGLYVESGKQSVQGGSVLYLETTPYSSFSGSGMVLYYHNDSVKTNAGKDSALIMPYIVTQYSARVNRIQHDYTNTPFFADINSETNQDSLIYVQATGGLESKIFIDNLQSWNDSVNTAINKAELIFQIDTVASQVKKFPPPNQLLFTIVDSTGVDRLPIDYVFSPTFYGGVLKSDYTYRFNITQHLQKIIGGEKNYGFYLTTAFKNNQANRVVLKSGSSKTGIKLSITYSKYSK